MVVHLEERLHAELDGPRDDRGSGSGDERAPGRANEPRESSDVLFRILNVENVETLKTLKLSNVETFINLKF